MNYSPDTAYRFVQERASDLHRVARNEQLLRSNRRAYRTQLAQWLTGLAERLEGRQEALPQAKPALR